MNVEFSVIDGKEFVSISGGMLGKDAVVREATEDDRRQFADQYAAFKSLQPPAAPAEPAAVPAAAPKGKGA